MVIIMAACQCVCLIPDCINQFVLKMTNCDSEEFFCKPLSVEYYYFIEISNFFYMFL